MHKIIYYQPELHLNQIQNWFKKYNMNVDSESLPSTGFVVDNICAAFLLETNSNVCFIDYLISNPDIDKKLKNKQLNCVVKSIQNLARSKGYKYMISNTKHKAVVDRAILNGFNVLPDFYFSLGMEL